MIENQDAMQKLWVKTVTAFLCAGLLAAAVPKQGASSQSDLFWQIQPNEPGLLRLHVVANSNRPADQLFKSNLVEEVQRLLADSGAQWAAGERAFIDDNLPLLQDELQRYASLPGNPAPEIRVTLAKAEFPLRSYGRVIYPPGEYLSLTVLIGEGAGDNWWCLLFPPLCLPMAEATVSPEPEAELNETSSVEQTSFQETSTKPQPGWRFKLLEQWGRWFGSN